MSVVIDFPRKLTAPNDDKCVLEAHGIFYLVPHEDGELFDWMLRCLGCVTVEFDASWPRRVG